MSDEWAHPVVRHLPSFSFTRHWSLITSLGVALVMAPSVWGLPAATGVGTPTPSQSASLSFEERLAQPVTADFQEVDFSSAIEFLAETAGVNIILSEKAKTSARPVTVHLVAMPLNRALNYLLKGQGLVSRRDGEAIWVATRDEIEA